MSQFLWLVLLIDSLLMLLLGYRNVEIKHSLSCTGCIKNTVDSFSSDGKESACNAADLGSISGWVDPWRRERLLTPVFLPGEFQGQRSLVGYDPQGRKELDMSEQLNTQVPWVADFLMTLNILKCNT